MGLKACGNVTLSINSVDFSAFTDSLSFNIDVTSIDYQTLDDCAIKKIPSFPRVTLEHQGYYNGPDAGELEREIYDAMDGNAMAGVPVVVTFDTVTYTFSAAFSDNLRIEAPVDGVLITSGKWQSIDGSVTRS